MYVDIKIDSMCSGHFSHLMVIRFPWNCCDSSTCVDAIRVLYYNQVMVFIVPGYK